MLKSRAEWTAVEIRPKILRIIAMVAGRAFVGPKLNHTEDWIHQMINFTIDIFQGGQKLKEWNWMLRPIVQWIIPDMRRIREHHKKAAQYLEPTIKLRIAEEAKPGYQKKNDAIQWLMDRSRKAKGTVDPKEVAYYQLLFSFAAIHTTSGATLHMLFDLAARPEYVVPLREEVTKAWDEAGGNPDRSTVMKLEKLDSFMKESQRLNPPGMGKSNHSITHMVWLTERYSIIHPQSHGAARPSRRLPPSSRDHNLGAQLRPRLQSQRDNLERPREFRRLPVLQPPAQQPRGALALPVFRDISRHNALRTGTPGVSGPVFREQ